MSGPALNRRLTLEAPVATADGAGGVIESWQALGTIWADMKPDGGALRGEGSFEVAEGRWRITVRGAPKGAASRPEPGQRFRKGARTFRIEVVQEADASARYLVCRTKEEVAVP